MISRLIFIGIAVLIVVRLYLVRDIDAALVGLVAVILIGTMVWFSDFWSRYILPFGFWESKASDFKTPERSRGAIVFIGWVFLALLGYTTFFV